MKKVIIEIEIPNGKENCLLDKDGKLEGYAFEQIISKALTKKHFGHGAFAVNIKEII